MDSHSPPSHPPARWIITLSALMLAVVAIKYVGKWTNPWPFMMPAILIGYHCYPKLNGRTRAALLGLVMAVIAVSVRRLLGIMHSNVAHPPEWDFLGFWLNGKVAVQGLNFYETAHAHQLAQPFHPSPEFVREILDVGFWYPPPSIFLFAPLGWFEFRTAYLLWYIFHGAVLVVCILMIWKVLLKKEGQSGLMSLAFVASLVLVLHGTRSTIEYGQTNFMALLMVLLFWHDRALWRAGLWVAIGIFTKPFLAALLMFLVLRRHWRVLASSAAFLALFSLVTCLIFGPRTFLAYFRPGHYAALPGWVYVETSNQSLLATILRLTHVDPGNSSPLGHPAYVLLSLLLTGVTGWRVFRLDKPDEDWGLALTVLLALLIYPVSQMFYSVLLIVPILLLWNDRLELRLRPWGVLVLLSLGYLLANLNSNESFIFPATALFWIACLVGIGRNGPPRRLWSEGALTAPPA
jgi:hypothetical protein